VRACFKTRMSALSRMVLITGLMVSWGCSSKQGDAPEGSPGGGSTENPAWRDSGTAEGSDSGQETGVPLLNFSLVFAEVIGPSCRGCHSGQAAAGDLRLETESDSFVTLLADYVVPGDPEASILVSRIVLDIEDDSLMPPRAPLTATKVSIVVDWVDAGAPE
jgi:hypothetical protein